MVRITRSPRGVTLLELLLALGLTAVVMVLIAMAIDLNLRTLESRRADVERAQLARAILRHIAADLRNAVVYQPLDMTGVPQLAGGLIGGGAGSGDMSGMDGSLELEGSLSLDGTDSTLNIAGSVTPRSVPGLVGSQTELQVDVSRLPRVDQYQQAMMNSAEGEVMDVPSDVKTVAYYLQYDALGGALPAAQVAAGGSGSVPLGASEGGVAATGLMRRELDRAVTAWASQNGGLDETATSGQLLAPEVNFLEFRYFDGMEWWTEWDSQTQNGLPVAVEVTIGIDPSYGLNPESMDAVRLQESALADATEFTYRLVIRLPAARPVAMTEESLEVLGL